MLSFSCEKEYLEVRDGGTELSPLLGRFCRGVTLNTQTSHGNMLFVHYYTDLEDANTFSASVTLGKAEISIILK